MSYLLAGMLSIYTFYLMQYTRKLVAFIRVRHPEFIMVRHPEVWEAMDKPCFWFLDCRICIDLYIQREWIGLNDGELRSRVNRFYAMALPCLVLVILFAVVAYSSIQAGENIP